MSLKTDDFKSYLYSIDREELFAMAVNLNIDPYAWPNTEELIDEIAERLEDEES